MSLSCLHAYATINMIKEAIDHCKGHCLSPPPPPCLLRITIVNVSIHVHTNQMRDSYWHRQHTHLFVLDKCNMESIETDPFAE